jgi:hypothetical protein
MKCTEKLGNCRLAGSLDAENEVIHRRPQIFGEWRALPSQREIYFEGITVSMWKMRKIVDRNCVTLHMSGHLEAKHLVEIQNALADEKMGANVVLDLSEVTLIAREAIKFLARFEVDRIDLQKCPAYIRNWIARERKNGKNSRSQESEECAE